jgi:hypothetical protein
MQGARPVRHKTPFGRHHGQRVTGPDILGRPTGKHTPLHGPNSNAQFTFGPVSAQCVAKGITAADVLPINRRLQGKELARYKSEIAAQVRRHLKGDSYGTGCFSVNAADCQGVEAGQCHGILVE